MKAYDYRVSFFDTDAMGVVHHSNYIRWLEKARIEFLRLHEVLYNDIVKSGLHLPVIELQCKYKNPCFFDDQIEVDVEITHFKRASFTVFYPLFRNVYLVTSL